MNTTNTDITSTIGTTDRTALVHKQDAEGAITIDPMTGRILTPLDERPEWAAELTIAQMAERDTFYIDKLGPLYTEDRQHPEVYAFEDLGWLGMREYPVDAPYVNPETGETSDHELLIYDADHEFRQQQLGTALGIEAELDEHGNETGGIKDALASVEIGRDDSRTEAEVAAIEQEQQAGMKAVNE